MTKPKLCAILVGGGPAPGINSVIRAATIKLKNEGVRVIGIFDGYEHLMMGDISQVTDLQIDDVSNIHFEGGSILRTSRANPVTREGGLKNVLASMEKLGVDALMTIGGDDTCFTAVRLEKESGKKIQIIHIPKTIDNDLNLPADIRTFGFATARHYGYLIIKNLMNDAKTTKRWYLITAMGRKAGHLALGIGKPSGATLTIIPEEFPEKQLSPKKLVDIIVGAIIKRRAAGRFHGVAVLAEGLAQLLSQDELKKMGHIELDQFGHIRLSEIDLGGILKHHVKNELHKLGISTTVVDKDIGYELRSVEPVPFDVEYTQDLGYSAANYLLDGNSGHMASIQEGRFVPIPFDDMLDSATGKPIIRMVNISTQSYKVAYEYMIRLKKEDFINSEKLQKLAAAANLPPDEFRKRFGYLVVL
ncbi:MAG: diphosphate--fructose-6-phosphate 1-phosphotransferase [Nitrospinota bacterium]